MFIQSVHGMIAIISHLRMRHRLTFKGSCRVGKIVEVGNHPSADTLYVEQIDLGEGKPRQVGI